MINSNSTTRSDTHTYISTREAGKLASLSHDYISKLAREGVIEGVRQGRRWLVSKESVLLFLNNLKDEKEKRSELLRLQRKAEQVVHDHSDSLAGLLCNQLHKLQSAVVASLILFLFAGIVYTYTEVQDINTTIMNASVKSVLHLDNIDLNTSNVTTTISREVVDDFSHSDTPFVLVGDNTYENIPSYVASLFSDPVVITQDDDGLLYVSLEGESQKFPFIMVPNQGFELYYE